MIPRDLIQGTVSRDFIYIRVYCISTKIENPTRSDTNTDSRDLIYKRVYCTSIKIEGFHQTAKKRTTLKNSLVVFVHENGDQCGVWGGTSRTKTGDETWGVFRTTLPVFS